jgi:hypothetical protein
VTEAELLRAIMLDLGGRPNVRIFRNVSGLGVNPAGQKIRFGLAVGAPDLLGILAPEGRLIGLEVKTETGRVRPEQAAFLAMLRSMGGIAAVVRSVADARAALSL